MANQIPPCPDCGATDAKPAGYASDGRRRRYRCNQCGRYYRQEPKPRYASWTSNGMHAWMQRGRNDG